MHETTEPMDSTYQAPQIELRTSLEGHLAPLSSSTPV
jgi:hypothetical protein